MKVAELIAKLQKMPQDWDVEVNSVNAGEVYPVESVEDYPEDPGYPDVGNVVIIQVNSR